MRESQITDVETTAWIEAGLQCDGVELNDWEQDAIVKYGRHLLKMALEQEMKQAIKERDEAVRQLVLVRNEYHAFFRKINNIE